MGARDQFRDEESVHDVTGITNFGVAILDDPELSSEDSSGWASVGGDRAFRFARLSDLESDTIWLNNATFDAARRAKHYSIHNLRGESFLGSRLAMILDDITAGAHPPNNTVAQQLAQIADRTCRFAVRSYKENVLGGYSLGAGIQTFLGETKVPSSGELWLDAALAGAYQKGASCNTQNQPFIKNAKSVYVRQNRLVHTAKVMEGMIPEGGFEYIPSTKRPMTADFLLKQNRPVLAQISVSKVDPDVSGILGFGSFVGGRQGRILREWVAGPELALVAEFASVNVKSAILWEEATPLPRRFQLPSTIDDGLLAMSYSVGLVAESHLAALTSGKRNDQTQMMQYTARAVFMAALDRVLTFPIVRALRNEGFTILYYGGGGALVRTSTSMLPRLSDFTRDAALSFPLPDIAERKLAA